MSAVASMMRLVPRKAAVETELINQRTRPMDDDPSPFTFAGRVVILLAIVIGIGGPLALFWWSHESGNESPLALRISPFGAPLALSYIGYWILRFLGIPFMKDDRND